MSESGQDDGLYFLPSRFQMEKVSFTLSLRTASFSSTLELPFGDLSILSLYILLVSSSQFFFSFTSGITAVRPLSSSSLSGELQPVHPNTRRNFRAMLPTIPRGPVSVVGLAS